MIGPRMIRAGDLRTDLLPPGTGVTDWSMKLLPTIKKGGMRKSDRAN